MTEQVSESREGYYQDARSWAFDQEQARLSSSRAAWVLAGVVSVIAVCEAVALAVLMPLKTVVPHMILVDRQTGYVQQIDPAKNEVITPDTALVRSFIAQYVSVREGFDINSIQNDYRKVALWSAGEAKKRYMSDMRASSPSSPFASLPRQALVQSELQSISFLSNNSAFVRFVTKRTDPGRQSMAPKHWAAVIKYRFSAADMSAADRLINPLGFQVLRYRRDAEMPVTPQSETMPIGATASAKPVTSQKIGRGTTSRQTQP